MPGDGGVVVITTSVTLPTSTAIRLRYLAQHLHDLGPRPTFELLCELVGGADPLDRLERYARLDPTVVRKLGGAEIPSRLMVLKGGP